MPADSSDSSIATANAESPSSDVLLLDVVVLGLFLLGMIMCSCCWLCH